MALHKSLTLGFSLPICNVEIIVPTYLSKEQVEERRQDNACDALNTYYVNALLLLLLGWTLKS